jgi:hypothetical protein
MTVRGPTLSANENQSSITLTDQTLGLYDPWRDPHGEVAWRELKYAPADLKDEWCDRHFHWRGSVAKANALLKERGVAATIDLELADVRSIEGDGGRKLTEIDFVISVSIPRKKPYRLDECWSEESFGSAMFLAGNPHRLADFVQSFCELTPGQREAGYTFTRR